MIEEAVVTQVLASAAVAGLVGNRMYPHVAPQGALLPCIVYRVVGTQRPHSMDGGAGLARATIELEALASTFAAAAAVAHAIREAVQGKSGVVVASGGSAYDINGIFLDGETSDYDSEMRLHLVTATLGVWYNETQATPP